MITDFHDYLNVLNYMYLVGSGEMEVDHEVAYSDINGEVIPSYPIQVVNQLMLIKASQDAAAMEELMQEEDFDDFNGVY